MPEIKCPNCGEVFVVSETGYAQIVKQVRDKEFDKELMRRDAEHTRELERREQEYAEKVDSNVKMAVMEQKESYSKELTVRKEEYDKALNVKEAEIAERDRQIQQLRAELAQGQTERELAVAKAVQEQERELAKKADEMSELKSRMTEELTALRGQISVKDSESALREKTLQEKYEDKLREKDDRLREKDEQIAYYKDFKARQSTKMVGESLEQHCLNEFNKYRMAAFPNAYFEKDNDAKTGSKGDFIYRESEDETEFISIMFEMKNEMDTTATKHKNEDFLKELDKDRREKKCEYAVLVSLLEADSELYNSGIVDVSYRYEKMYVIRPQFFIPMISLLRNASRNSIEYRRELELARNQQLDLLHFEENMKDFKEGFARNYRLASERFQTAIDEIDKTIDHLEKTKKALLSSENNLRLANQKADELTIKKLTKNAPGVRSMFEQSNNGNAD